jgi:hypothetical protein
MKKLALVPLLSAALVFGQSAKSSSSATVGTGSDLVRKCSEAPAARSIDEGVSEAYAQGYCFGVLTTAAEILDSDGQIHFPDGASFPQIQKIVMNYLNAHPEEWQKPASLLVKQALKQAWGS